MTALWKLFFKDPQPADALFFSQTKKIFCCKYLIDKLKSRFAKCKIDVKNYLSHNFRRGAAQHSSDCGTFNKNIQKLGQ